MYVYIYIYEYIYMCPYIYIYIYIYTYLCTIRGSGRTWQRRLRQKIHNYKALYTKYISVYIHIHIYIYIPSGEEGSGGRDKVDILQCVAVCCSVLQCVAVCCSALHQVAETTRQGRHSTKIVYTIHGVATISMLLKTIGLFCRISSL